MDPIADYLTHIRNAIRANPKLPRTEIKSSLTKKRITEILHREGYIESYDVNDTKNYQGTITITLKYDAKTKHPAIVKLLRISKPSKRIYKKARHLTAPLNGLGINIVSTSQGIMTGREARKKGIGGEELCHIY